MREAPDEADTLRQLTVAPRRALLPLIIGVSALLLFIIGMIVFIIRERPHRGTPIRSIAVLPFRPLDEHQGDRTMELGIADTLINKLSRSPQLIVSPIRAVIPFLDHPVDAVSAGRQLGVDAVIEGNLHREGQRIRCNVRLLRVSDGRAEWADEYDEEAADVFTLEDRIADRTAVALDLRLNARGRLDFSRRYTENREAYSLYERGRLEWATFEPDHLLASIRYYEAALQHDPNYALAYAGIAKSYNVINIYGPLPAEEANARARENADRALRIDPDLPPAHIALAAIAIFHDRNWSVAANELQRVLDTDPNSVDAHTLRGYLRQAQGRPADALDDLRRARELDPTWQITQNDMLLELFYLHRFDEASSLAQQLVTLEPHNLFARNVLARVLMLKGDLPNARAVIQANLAIEPSGVRSLATLGTIEARAGHRQDALRCIDEITAETKKDDLTRRGNVSAAAVYAALGEKDKTFELLDRAFEERYPFLYRVRLDPEFDSIRSDPRYGTLLARMGLQ
jgi:TolB-like protein/Tfp pilus assembly protein PilF